MRQNNSCIPHLRGPVTLIHLLARQFVHPGDHVVDATCGNGKDTLVLAELVGADGHVSAFDIQQPALERTAARLAEAGLSNRVSLFATGHERIAELVSAPLSAVVFNLGWLPGGDRAVITRPETTRTALEASLGLLAPDGVILLTCYPGHHGGDDESGHLLQWAAALPPQDWHVWRMGQLNVSAEAPFCLVIQKGSQRHAS